MRQYDAKLAIVARNAPDLYFVPALRGKGTGAVRTTLLTGVATTALSIALPNSPGAAATLDDVMQRLEALERSNAKLARENADLRNRVKNVERPMTTSPAAAAAAPMPIN